MRILYVTTEATPRTFVLATTDESGVGIHVGPSGGSGPHERNVQPADLLRATSPIFLPRGNRKNYVSFSVSVLFASVADCWAYRFSYPESLPDDGELRMEIKDAAGQIKIWKIVAALRSVSPIIHGLTLDLTYSFYGSEMVLMT